MSMMMTAVEREQGSDDQKLAHPPYLLRRNRIMLKNAQAMIASPAKIATSASGDTAVASLPSCVLTLDETEFAHSNTAMILPPRGTAVNGWSFQP